MKQKKQLDWVSIIGIALSVAGFFWWQTKMQKQYAERYRAQQEQRKAAEAAAAASPGSSPVQTVETTTPTPPPRKVDATPQAPEKIVKVESTPVLLDLIFTTRGGGIKTALLPKHGGVGGNPIELNRDSGIPIGAITEKDLSEATADYTIVQSPNSVVFERINEAGLKITKTFSWPEKAEFKTEYGVDLEVAFTNTGNSEFAGNNYLVHTGAAEPIHLTDQLMYESYDFNKNGKIEKVATTWFDGSGFLGMQFRPKQEVYELFADNMKWAAVKNQFYTSIIFPVDGTGNRAWARRFQANVKGANGEVKQMPAIEGALGMPGIKAKPGETIRKQFRLYLGPKEYSRLSAIGTDAKSILNFWPFEIVSVFLLSAMNLFNHWFGNYATAIIVLTVLIKLALWPLQAKSMRSMKEMSALTPKVAELKEKYANDPAKLNQEVMLLYKTYGVNPLAGCLPLLVQIPIFFGFYAMLGTAVELRNSSFLWVKDLTQPDTVGHLLGFPINLLPLVMAATMLWQMNLTPKTGDQMQQRIFMFMPLIFIVFCYNYASALPLYWTVQNLFSIVQIYLTRDKPVPPLTKKAVEPPPGRPGKTKAKKRASSRNI